METAELLDDLPAGAIRAMVARINWLNQRDQWAQMKRFMGVPDVVVARFNRSDRRAMGITRPRPNHAKRVAGRMPFLPIEEHQPVSGSG